MNKKFIILTALVFSFFANPITYNQLISASWEEVANTNNQEVIATGYGEISSKTGRPKTVHVRGYHRKDGTYVKPHYRSPPRR